MPDIRRMSAEDIKASISRLRAEKRERDRLTRYHDKCSNKECERWLRLDKRELRLLDELQRRREK